MLRRPRRQPRTRMPWRVKYCWRLARQDHMANYWVLPFTRHWWWMLMWSIIRPPILFAMYTLGVWRVEDGFVLSSGRFCWPSKNPLMQRKRKSVQEEWYHHHVERIR